MIKWLIIISCLLFFISCFGPSQSYATSQQIAFVSSRDENFEIYTMDINGFNPINLSQNNARDKYPQFSPDGSKLVFASDREGDYDIFIMTLVWYGGYIRYKGVNLINLSSQLGNDLYPEFSPTGLEIVFESLQNDNYEIFSVDTLGNNKSNLTQNIGQDRKPKFSSNGEHIVFWSNRDGNDEIYVMTREGFNPTRLTNDTSYDINPNFSPLDDKIIFESNRDGNKEIYMMNSDGSNQINISMHEGLDNGATFSTDGFGITWVSNRDGNKEIYYYDIYKNYFIKNLTRNFGSDENITYQPWSK